MARLAKAGAVTLPIRNLSLRLTQGLPSKAFRAEAEALFYWVRDNIRYVGDVYGVETLTTPEWTIRNRSGDCDDMVTLLAALLLSINHPVRFIAIGKKPGVYEHVYLETKVGDQWIACEPTEPWVFGQVAPGLWYKLTYHV